ncbi:MAG: cadherin-like beta sandwich domain-containing protein [Oscillospiraceae bacterium]|nr:cadherin-like beta sandwich domain-containing protein [Oscillospiraceae bacterium]
MKLKRMTAVLLLLAMLLSCLPLSVLAADAEPVEAENTVDTAPAENTDAEVTTEEPVEEAAISTQAVNASGYFYFSAETANKLLIAPMRIAFTDGQTIRQALYASQYSFVESNSSGFITTIEGVNGNYIYGSAPDSVSIDSAANTVTHFRFSEASNSTPSSGLQTLMQVMADYLEEDSDIQNAAAEEYQTALNGYLNVTSETAQSYAAAITAKINAYKAGQNTKYAVTFSGYSGSGYTVSAVSDYGKQFEDTGHTGKLQLPAGGYTFYVRQDNCMVSGKITVSGAMTVSASLPTGDWFNESSLQISSGYDAEFDANCYKYTLQDHTATVQVPDSFTGRLYPYFTLNTTGAAVKAVYTDISGAARDKAIPAESKATSIDNALSRGAAGNTVALRASKTGSDGYTQSVDLTLQLDRMPTLGSLRVTNAADTAQAATESFSSTKTEYTYKILDSEQVLKIYPTATVSGSSITVNGNKLDADDSATVTISGNTTVTIAVSSGNYTTTYTLTIQPGQGKKVTFNTASDVTLTVVNKNGEELAYTKTVGTGGTINYLYTLVPGDDYSYVATQGTYYHAKKSFTLDSNEVIQVSVKQEDWLTSLALSSAADEKYKGDIELSPSFAKSVHTYTATVPDNSSSVYVWRTNSRGNCAAVYSMLSTASDCGKTNEVALKSRFEGDGLAKVLLPGSAYGNTVTIRVTYTDNTDGVTYYTDYLVSLERSLSLKNISASFNGSSLPLQRKNSQQTGFSLDENEYSILIPAAATTLDLLLQKHTESPKYGDTDNGYVITVNGKAVSSKDTATVDLTGTEEEENVQIKVTNKYVPGASGDYVITVKKAATTSVTFQTNPKNALIYIYEQGAGNRVWPDEDGSFALSEGFTYYCSISLYGYAAQAGTLQIVNESGQTVLRFGEEDYTNLSAVSVTLQKAAANPDIVDYAAEWANFRGTDSNNGITSAKTPVDALDGMLYWASHLGNGWDTGAVSSPILVDDCLVVYADNKIYRVSKATGEVETEGDMAGTSSFAINGPTYADGILLVGLSNGRIQAFNAKTLESLWIYKDPVGDQPNCPITILNGYAYTGFWNGESKDSSFVCISLTDEDPENEMEEKAATWRMVQNGGFYWAGAYACDDFVIVGTDDGEAQCSYLYLLDPLTGKVLDFKSGFDGDIRSTICYDSVTKAYYFTSKGGTFYRAKVEAQNGSYAITACDGLKLDNGSDDPALPPMSTSTPVVYKGRAYIGVSGTGQFTQYSGHNITVIDLKNWKIAYSVKTQGYPQTSGLLTTAYEENNGYVYVYFFDNYTPGTLRVLRDKKGQDEANYLTSETFNDETYQTAYALFSPNGKQAQYAICSPITDSDGTIYFKNDSGYLMAFGRSIKKIEVTKQPNKTQYNAGEIFDKTGMVVTATLSDGTTRDVTDMVSAPAGTLADGTTELTLEFGRGQTMYRNLPNGNKMTAGNKIAAITTTIQIRVGDTTDTGALTDNIAWSFQPSSNTLSIGGKIPEGNKVLIACYDDSGKMTKLEVRTVSGSVTLPDSAKIRVFYIDGNSKPLCAAAAVLG